MAEQPARTDATPDDRAVFTRHSRLWRQFQYVYPVVSRRSRGLSIGININIDNACNFDCVYCCVDRTVPPPRRDLDLAQVRRELDDLLALATSGAIWREAEFADVRPAYRRLNDIAFSGNGEPSVHPRFAEAVQLAAELKAARGLDDVKLIVITNATGLDRPKTRQALEIMDANQGEVWAKLDAGTESYYQRVDRTRVPLTRVLANILDCGRRRPIVIQSLFMRLAGEGPSDAEFDAYIGRLRCLLDEGAHLKAVQLYTVARRPAESYVTPLPDDRLDAMAERLRAALPALAVDVYYGVG